MFRRSKNNSYDTSQTKQRFSIKKFKFGAASVLIGISFLGGFTQGQFNISTDTVFAAEVLQGSAATLNTSITKNMQNGNAYIDLYDVKLGKIDPLQLIVLKQGFTAKYVIKQGTQYYGDVSQLQSTGGARVTYNIFSEDGQPHVKPDGQTDIVSVNLTVYDTTVLRKKLDDLKKKAEDPNWSENSRNEVLEGVHTITEDLDNNPQTEANINDKIILVDELDKKLVVDPRTDADKNDPAGKDQTVNMGEQPDPTKSLEEVPAGSTVAYKDPVDTKTPGEKDAVVVVTYPDKSTDEVPVKVTVVDPRTDADKNDPTGKDQTVNMGEQPDPTKSLEEVPAGSTVAYKDPVDTKTPGEKDAVVVVTYPDKSTDEVPVKVTVVDPRTDADKNDPAGKDQTVNMGEQPDPTKSLEEVPAGSTVAYKDPVDTKTPGEKDAVVVVTYPDKSTDEVPVKVTVVDPRTDADKNDPAGKDQTVNMGEQPDPTKSLEEVPAGSTVAYKDPVDTKTPGEKDAVVVVTYPDKSTDEVPVKVTVVDPRTDADKNDPTGKDQTVNMGEQPDPTKSLEEVPAGSTVAYKDPVDTKTPGEKDAVVVVTYPDKSTDEVPVKVTVVDPRTDADKNDPAGKDQTVNMGEQPDPTKSLEEVPAGSTVAYKDPVDTKTPGEKDAVVVVTYPDKSTDEVPVKVTVVDPRTDADKNDPTGKDQTVNMGEQPDPTKSLEEVPAGSTVAYKDPVDTKTPGEKDAVVVVTYPDKSTDEVPVKVTVVDPRTDADKNDPAGKDQTVNMGEQPDPTKSLEEVPAGSTVAYKDPVDTKTPGEKDAVVVVTYPDKSTDEVPVKVTVVDPRTDADKNDPAGKDQTVNMGEQPDPTKSLEEVPAGSTVAYKDPVDTKTPGEKDAVVVVTYPDKSTDEVPVKVTVVDPRTDADKNDPAGKDQTVNMGEQPDPTKSLEEVPAGSTVAYKDPVDTKTPGEKDAVVVVTYPDKSTDEVPVKVTVVDPRTDADKNDPTGKDQTVNMGEQPDPTKSLEEVPAGSTVAYKDPVDTKTPGEKDAVVVVTYPDKSTDEVPVKVTVVDPRTDADKNDPAGKDQTVNMGEQPDPTKSLEEVPAGSTVAYKDPVDTKTPGEKDAVVVVTYPDKSTDEVPVKVTVVDPRTDADKNDPTGKDQTVNMGEQPDPTKSLEEVPAGSTVAYKDPVDTKTPGEKDAVVVVTYPDKSTDEVPVKVTVVDPRTDADKNDPAGKDQTVNMGEQPDPTKSLEEVPAGSTVAYKDPVDTKTPGEKDAVVVVTYPDKSTDEVPVKVTVVDPRTDADKNDPAGKDQTVNMGEQPDPTKSLEEVPAGSTVAYKDPVDTKTPGEKDAVVVVTYPDKSTDEVPVKVTVVDPRTDADKNDPTGKDQTVNMGEQPDPTKSLEEVPAGSTVAYKDPVDTKTPGEKDAVVVVTYPDKSTDEVPVKVTVVDPRTDADKNDPAGKDQTVNMGEQPDPTKSLEEVPAGSTVAYKDPVDTKTPGEKDAVVVVTYPDKSTDEVPVKVTVVDPRTDADKNDPTGKDQTVNMGEQPDPTKSLEEVPAGSTVAYKDPVDTKTPGEKDAVVVVTYPDKSTDEVPVKVTVVDPRTDADKNDPAGKDQTVNMGEQPDPTKSLEEVPAGSTVAYKDPVDTKTPGEKDAVVVVTYPDKSTDEVPVKVTVVDPRTDADKNDPAGKDQTVNMGEQPDPTKSLEEVPAGSTVAYKDPVDTKTPGEKDAVVVVTYPDKSTDEVPVKVTVVDPRTDADKNDPTGKDQTVNMGEQPDPTKSLEEVPAGSTVAYKDPVDTKTPGEKDAVVVVTYPDKSTDEVPVKVTVVDPRTDADKNDPAGKDQTVNMGEQPDPTKSLEEVPAGSTVAYKDPVDTKTPGEKDAVVVVTYPDKSTDEVPVKVTVVDPRTDADKNDPTGKNQQVNGKGNKLPATGENATPFFNVAALTIISSVGLLSVSKKKED
ncbi:surface protein Rib [Streptococcus agalactiae]|uniref:alpha-like surface protein n=4 Tax=Streptococcus agalactiae TaxID=1311 RepID=UPI000DF8B7BE|nr:alpha-like surface protein [Streptococcus agalactiae]SUN03270.1 surface protein Rib [Streptococcus agalactiae]